jgi:hypothetical protein
MMIAASDKIPNPDKVVAAVSQLEQLKQIQHKLRLIGGVLTQSTILAIFVVLFALTTRNFNVDVSFYLFSVATVFITFFSISVAFQFDKEKRRGEIVFDELSDSLHGKTEDGLLQQVNLETRIVMRTFVHDSDLPLVKSRNAAAIYVAVNLVAVVLSLLFLRP